MKQGINIILPVKISGIDLAEVDEINFVFKQVKSPNAPALKTSVYKSDGSGDATKRQDLDIIDIPWSSEETFLFIADSVVYMDTLISVKNSLYNPVTPICNFRMDMTLFEEEYDDEDYT